MVRGQASGGLEAKALITVVGISSVGTLSLSLISSLLLTTLVYY